MADGIIFIHGIMGSKLVDINTYNYDYIWTGLQSNFERIEDLELTLQADQGNLFDEKVDTIIGKADVEGLAYKEVISFCKRNFSNLPFFIFNYDWRFSAIDNGQKLHEYITNLAIKGKSLRNPKKLEKFHFITHSMGNFILRAYIKVHDPNLNHIDKIVFAAPPFLGSIDTVSAILVGEGWFSAKDKMRKLVRTFPGAIELLPNHPKAALWKGTNNSVDLFDSNNWQSNVTSPDNPYADKFIKNLINAVKTVRNDLFDLTHVPDEKRNDILILVGSRVETMQDFKVEKNPANQPVKNFFDLDNVRKSNDGDGRVPLWSSSHYASVIQTICIQNTWYNKLDHALFLNDNRVQRLIKAFFKTKEGSTFSFDEKDYIGDSVKRL